MDQGWEWLGHGSKPKADRVITNALQAASDCSHEVVIQLLLEKNIHVKGGKYCNVLQAALADGHEAVVCCSWRRTQTSICREEKYGNVLQVALDHGHEVVVQLLLEKNTDVHVKGGKYGKALQVALACGHKALVWLLLERNMDVHLQGDKYGTRLQAPG